VSRAGLEPATLCLKGISNHLIRAFVSMAWDALPTKYLPNRLELCPFSDGNHLGFQALGHLLDTGQLPAEIFVSVVLSHLRT